MIGYKLMRIRKDGTFGSLFINRRAKIPTGVWLDAEEHPTKGYEFRPGWHILPQRYAPHLADRPDRVWVKVECDGVNVINRPASQGGEWWIARRMRVLMT